MAEQYGSHERYSGYDLIGDVHGCADALCELLGLLGYTRRGGVHQYRDVRRPRQVLFLGDIIDRGSQIRETALLVQAMVERGHARIVLGNHEHHALAYSTPRRDDGPDGRYLREHNERHTRLIAATLEQFAQHRYDWQDCLRWFQQMPLLLEIEPDTQPFRVIHACWDQALIDDFKQRCPTLAMDADFLQESVRQGSFAERLLGRATRGLDLLLPDGEVMTGIDGLPRRFFRCKFWVDAPRTYADLEFQPDRLPAALARQRLGEAERAQLVYYDERQPPLFIGHYWQQGEPAPLRANLACLDYSAVKGGRLVAYRMDGERELRADKFVWVDGLSRLSNEYPDA
jgi:hypothetical protein